MNVLITSGTGFIGSRIALTYLAKGHEVRFLDQENIPAEAETGTYLRNKGASIPHCVRHLARKVKVLGCVPRAGFEQGVIATAKWDEQRS